MDFSELKLARPLLKAVGEQGYEKPSPIQEKAIPPVLEGRDLLGCAQTGTSKTAAFALPILQRLAAGHPNHKGVRALILTPTRELALQIDECFENYGRYVNVSHAVIFGGVGQAPQVAAGPRGGGAHRLPGPPERSDRPGLCGSCAPGGIRAGRGRPHAGHGLCARCEAGHQAPARPAAEPFVQRNHAQRDRAIGGQHFKAACEREGGSARQHGGQDPPEPLFCGKRRQKASVGLSAGRPGGKNALVFSRTKHGANAIAAF